MCVYGYVWCVCMGMCGARHTDKILVVLPKRVSARAVEGTADQHRHLDIAEI